MMDNTDQLFDDYLSGELSESQKREFEERLDSDETFRKKFDAHKMILGAIYASHDKKLLAEIADQKVKHLKPLYYWSIAASLLLIATVIWLIPFNSEEALISEGKVFNTPVNFTTKALAFTSTVDSLTIQLNHIKGTPRYEFSDTLKLYILKDPVKVEFSIKYFEDVKFYELTLDSRIYKLKRNSSGSLE